MSFLFFWGKLSLLLHQVEQMMILIGGLLTIRPAYCLINGCKLAFAGCGNGYWQAEALHYHQFH